MNRKVCGSTLLETIVALVLILLGFYLFSNFIYKIYTTSSAVKNTRSLYVEPVEAIKTSESAPVKKVKATQPYLIQIVDSTSIFY